MESKISESQVDVEESDTTTLVEAKSEDELSFSGDRLFSKPVVSEKSTIPPNIVEYLHSFGYDCKRSYNLCVMEPNLLAFVSGNLIHFLRVDTSEVTTRRSVLGGGIGFIKKNPKYNNLTVAENGKTPPIFIYNWPDMELVSVLRNGADLTYSCLDYSPDGEMLVSQAGDPDYTLTVWNWKEEKIVLKVKSYHNDVLNLMFSPTVIGQLTTCGNGHIKFWKMAQTFTGLKLQGEVARFGKTEISDICGIYPMPDERVLSGCEWGNILVWEHGLITLEVCRKGKRRCHGGPVTQIFARDGEIITIATDGYIRVWFWETVELADPPENNRFVEIEPIYEFRIGPESYNAELMCMVHAQEDTQKYYLQDGNGGIWTCDITPDAKGGEPRQFFWCHAGPIFAICTSPISSHVATFGRDGRLFMYNYETKKLVFHYQFISQGDDMIWLQTTIDPTGIVIILAFDDGVIRVITVNLDEDVGDNVERVQLIQVMKSHSEPIRKMSINQRETILVSGGDDNIIFIHQISKEEPYVVLKPIGLVKTPSAVSCINWKPDTFSTILVGCKGGEVMEADLPEQPRSYTEISYRLTHIKPRILKFVSTKGQILRNKKLAEIEKRKAAKRKRKMKELEQYRKDNPNDEINEDAFLSDSESEEEVEPAFKPKAPNKVLWAQYTSEGTIWLSMSGFDAGYIYEYKFGYEGPIKCTPIPKADNVEINSYLYFEDFLIFGMGDGSLRINKVKDDFTDLRDHWILNMHDNQHGNICCMNFSFDKQFIFTGGADGNLFLYRWNRELRPVEALPPKPPQKLDSEIEDITDICSLSLEEEKQKADHDRRLEIALARKNEVMQIIAKCKEEYDALIKRNKALPVSQQIPWSELELDPRITQSLQKRFDSEMELVKQKKAFDVEKVKLAGEKLRRYYLEPLDSYPIEVIGINTKNSVKSFRVHKLDEDYKKIKIELDIRVRRDEERKRIMEESERFIEESLNEPSEEKETVKEEIRRERMESFLQGLTESDIELHLDTKCRRLLKRYRIRKEKEAQRTKEWNEINALKPDPDVNHPDDDRDLREAEQTIGDYKLKIDANFDASEEDRSTTLRKIKEILTVREEIFNVQSNFNKKIFKLRATKVEVFKFLEAKKQALAEIHRELHEENRKKTDIVVDFNEDIEYPEKAFELETYMHERRPLIEIFRSEVPPFEHNQLDDIQREVLGLDVDGPQIDPMTLTEWERELIAHRRKRRLIEQDKIIDEINQKVKEFNGRVSKLFEERLQVEMEAKFLQQYLLTLNQEVWVLKDFEQLEEKLIGKVETIIFQRNKTHTDLAQERNLVDSRKRHIVELEEKQNEIEFKFTTRCRNDPYWRYLKRIFYKKYRAPRIKKVRDIDQDAEYETETESSLSTLTAASAEGEGEENYGEAEHDQAEEAATINFKELDENRCPDECDEELFELAHSSRKQYHSLQGAIIEDEAKIIVSMEEIENLLKELKKLKRDLLNTKEDLKLFRREKQQFLNNIETLVMLKMDQMQYFKTAKEIGDIDDTLLFSNTNITKLYSRVGQLALETLEVKRKHRVNVVHLSRMKADIKFMEQQIQDLKEEINCAMMKKFGRVVDLDELEEAILRRFVYEMRTNKEEVKREYQRKIQQVRRILASKEEELAKVIQEGTEKVNILTVLQEEKNYLHQSLIQQKKLEEKEAKREHYDYKKDVLKLREISKHQQEQIEALEREIRNLSFKCKQSTASSSQEESRKKTSDYRAVTPPPPPQPAFQQRVFEDSVYTNIVESRGDSSKCSTPNMELFKEINRIVRIFFIKTLKEKADSTAIQNLTCTLARYLTTVASSFAPETADKLLPEIIENFQSFIPDEVLKDIPKREIALLIEDVVGSFREEYDTEPKDVIQAIIAVSCEGLAKGHESYSQKLLTEIIKQMIVTMRLADVKNEERLKDVANEIKSRGFTVCALNFKSMATEIANYAAENYIDDVDQALAKQLIEKIIGFFTQKHGK